MKPSTHKHKTWVNIGENEIDCVVEFTAYPGDPGCTSGPPEKCYPPEPPELEILSIQGNGVELEGQLNHSEQEALEQRIWDAVEIWAPTQERDYE